MPDRKRPVNEVRDPELAKELAARCICCHCRDSTAHGNQEPQHEKSHASDAALLVLQWADPASVA